MWLHEVAGIGNVSGLANAVLRGADHDSDRDAGAIHLGRGLGESLGAASRLVRER